MTTDLPGSGGNDINALHQSLVDALKADRRISSPLIETAFRSVPRHLFLPDLEPEAVYQDRAIMVKTVDGVPVSSSSQPAIMGIMLEQLGLRPGHRVLEIGAGTGYNAALMAHIVGGSGQVVTIDIDEDLVEMARQHLSAAGFDRVQAICADGAQGYPSAAPYDRIILTVAAWDIAPSWLEQLKPGGRLVIPLTIRCTQKSIAFERANDHLESVSIADCGFITLRGLFAAPGGRLQLGPEPGLYINSDISDTIDADSLFRSMSGPSTDTATGVRVTPVEVFGSLSMWLALREPGVCYLDIGPELARRGKIPYVFRFSNGWACTDGIFEGSSICTLTRPPGQESPLNIPSSAPPFALNIRCYGPDASIGQRLLDQLRAWDAAGRPPASDMRIRAYPLDTDYAPVSGESVIPKRWNKLVVGTRG
jgi:protein-L-isoaspartate(D-aspartate) O-methyltransferase